MNASTRALSPFVLDVIRRRCVPVERETWLPMRTVPSAVLCSFCWGIIERTKPGTRIGERGTKAWWCRERGLWECTGCRSAAIEAGLP